MDIETLKQYYCGAKGYTIMLTDFLDEKIDDFEYILNNTELNIASFGFICCILLAIKENTVTGTRGNFESKIFYDNLLESINFIADKKSDGYYVDNHKFTDAASIVGEIRNKIAHGKFNLEPENNEVIFLISGAEVRINIENLSNMVISCLKSTLKRPEKNIYKRELVICTKIEPNRTKPFKNKDELMKFAKNFRINEVTFIRKDGKDLDFNTVKRFENMLNIYKYAKDTTLFSKFQKMLGSDYAIEFKIKREKYKILELAVEETLANTKPDMTYENQIELFCHTLELKRDSKFSLIISSIRNLSFIKYLKKIEIKDKENVMNLLRSNSELDALSYNELVSSGISLFASIFSYGNDDIFKNENEYTLNPNTGLDYENLDLSKITVLFPGTDDYDKTQEYYIRLIASNKRLSEINEKMKIENKNLENVKLQGNIKAMNAINSNISGYEAQKQILIQEQNLLNNKLNEINTYKNNNKTHIQNRIIINGIRNSIAHGNYRLLHNSNNDIKIIFEDIYNDVLTFKCEIDIIDFVNMIHENQEIVINFLNSKDPKLVRTIS